jgi:prevent-host-death family protein
MAMNVTATEAKNRLGKVLEQAQTKPVFIEKAGRRHSVVISSERYEQLLKAEAGASTAARKKQFNEQYKDWISEQNERFEKHGLWNEEFRRW